MQLIQLVPILAHLGFGAAGVLDMFVIEVGVSFIP